MNRDAWGECLDDNQIVELIERGAPSRGVELHLDSCIRCRQLLAMMARHEHRQESGVARRAVDPEDQGIFEALEREGYRLVRRLGEGGFGVVFEVEDRKLGRRLAAKTLKPDAEDRARSARRLKSEFRSVGDLAHPNLIALHELRSTDAGWFFTMDLIAGCDFLEYVRGVSPAEFARDEAPFETHREASGVLCEQRLRSALRQLVAGVHALHQAGIVHRDLKPSNVLVDGDGHLVVLDFGLARDEASSRPDTMAGTPVYMAPEQAQRGAAVPASDWYAVGVMLYEALAGRLPFAGSFGEMMLAKSAGSPEPPSTYAGVPPDLERLCLELLRRDPGARPSGEAILALVGNGGEAPSRRRERRIDLVGRAPELEMLRAAYAELGRGGSRIVELHGPPGMGKSALVEHFVRELEGNEKTLVLAGRCHEREAVPFKALDGVVDALAGYLRDLPHRESAALLPPEIQRATQLFPELATVPAMSDVPRQTTHPDDPGEHRRRAFSALKELLARLGDKHRLVLVIDDLQWGDSDSARLLAELLRWPDPPTMLLIASYRTDDLATSPALRAIVDALRAGGTPIEVALGPLSFEASMALCRQLAGEASDDRLRQLAQRAEGHPLFLEELARELPLLDDRHAAPSLDDLLWRRASRLPNDVRALLEIMAIAGEPLPRARCFEAAGLGSHGLEALRLLRAEQLARGSDDGIIDVFHDRIRQAVLAQIDRATRRMRHLGLARSLERSSDVYAEAIARHYDAAEEREQAGRYAAIAGDTAMATLAFDRAASLYRMSLERIDARGRRAEQLHVKLADALLHAGSTAAAGRAYIAAAHHADGLRAIDLKRRGAEHLLRMGDVEVGQAAAAESLEAVGQTLPDSALRNTLETIYNMARMRFGGFRCKLADADSVAPERLLELDVLESAARGLEFVDILASVALGTRFCRLALETGEPTRAVRALAFASFGLLGEQRERPVLVDHVLDRAAALAEQLDDPRLMAFVSVVRARTHQFAGHWAESLPIYDRTLALIEQRCPDLAAEKRVIHWQRAYASAKCGHFVSESLGRRWLIDALERQDPVSAKAVCLTTLVAERLAAGDLEQARHYVQRVAGVETRCALDLLEVEVRAAIAMYAGEPREAARLWADAWAGLRRTMVLALPGFRVVAARGSGVALAATADPPALGTAKMLIRGLSRIRTPYAAGARASIEALVAWRQGQPDRATTALTEAARHYATADMALDAAVCRHRWGSLVGGDDGRASMDAATQALRERGIAEPERWMAMQLPLPGA